VKHLITATLVLIAIVVGVLVTTSRSSSAQEDGTTTTTTTVPEPGFPDRFEFGFSGELPPEFDEFLSCLEGEGIDIPDELDGSFMFDLRHEDIEGLSEALENCELPGFGLHFGEGFPFDGDFPEDFPFLGELPEGFPFGEGFAEGFGDGFGFGLREHRVDRDELASCLAELGSFESVDEVRAQLDECLPEPPDFESLEGFAPFGRGKGGNGSPFGGFFSFGFEAPTPDAEGT
jgi:hypothetical protein